MTTKMLPGIFEAPPREVVAIGRAAHLLGREDAWDQVDKGLLNHILNHLLEETEETNELGLAMVDALDWSRDLNEVEWTARWGGYLELIEAARTRPSSAKVLSIALSGGKEVEILKTLYKTGRPAKGLDPVPVQRLQEAGLVYSHNITQPWVTLTTRGRDLSRVLKD